MTRPVKDLRSPNTACPSVLRFGTDIPCARWFDRRSGCDLIVGLVVQTLESKRQHLKKSFFFGLNLEG